MAVISMGKSLSLSGCQFLNLQNRGDDFLPMSLIWNTIAGEMLLALRGHMGVIGGQFKHLVRSDLTKYIPSSCPKQRKIHASDYLDVEITYVPALSPLPSYNCFNKTYFSKKDVNKGKLRPISDSISPQELL